MNGKPSNLQIIGVALVLFSAILLAVGIHHMVATGTCSSTGYSANFGPVPHCPSGTGAWFAFLFGGIIGCLAGAAMAGSVGLVFAGIFGGIGFGALTLVLDAHAHTSTKLFGAIFGACFAIVGVIAGVMVIGSAIGSLRSGSGGSSPSRVRPPSPTPAAAIGTSQPAAAFGTPSASAFGTPEAASAFGDASKDADPIMSAYNASRLATPPTPSTATTPALTPLGLVPGLQAAQRAAAGDSVDELAKLADLHKSGALTDQEFSNAKAKLLGQI